MQLRVVQPAKRLGMPDTHHPVAHHANIQHSSFPPVGLITVSRGSG
jgi:hypothetical protein